MPNITINGKQYEVEEGLTLIQVCDMFGVQIPRFCYHEKLPPVGSCRMCLIELKGSNKLVPACTTNVTDGMELMTESNTIDSARKTMLELLLTNHPLDCPICDQGGECDLQDQSYRYGFDRSSFNVEKRAVVDKNFGPLIDTYMTRCILCTRCVRFAREVAGIEELESIGRGDRAEIETYISKTVTSELSGNLVDVCPVGALTQSDYAFKARPWDTIATESIDVMDAVGSNIKIDSSPLAVLRILPRLNEDINEEWLGDKSRYIVDALRVQRLDVPLIRKDGKLHSCTWDQAFQAIAQNINKVKSNEIAIIAGDFVDVETMYAMKKLSEALNISDIDCRINNIAFNPKDRGGYLFNTTIAGIENSDLCLIVGSNPRKEAPIINARIRKRYLQGNYAIAVIGSKDNLNYKYNYLGESSSILKQILEGSHEYCKVLERAKAPMLIIGLDALQTENCENLIDLCKQIAKKYGFVKENWNGFNVLQTSISTIGGLDISFTPKDYNRTVNTILEDVAINKVKTLWLMNVDKINFDKLHADTFVIYQGHHGDKGASCANVILPSALWVEKDGTYVNTEGRVQKAYKAIPTLGDAKEDWKIIRKFSEYTNTELNFNTLEELRNDLYKEYPLFLNDILPKNDFIDPKSNTEIVGRPLNSIIENYYITDVISSNSVKMMECSKLFKKYN